MPWVSDSTTQKIIAPITGPETVATPPSSRKVQRKNVSSVP